MAAWLRSCRAATTVIGHLLAADKVKQGQLVMNVEMLGYFHPEAGFQVPAPGHRQIAAAAPSTGSATDGLSVQACQPCQGRHWLWLCLFLVQWERSGKMRRMAQFHYLAGRYPLRRIGLLLDKGDTPGNHVPGQLCQGAVLKQNRTRRRHAETAEQGHEHGFS